jgi:transcriptional regulator with XRE-family HTH domain
MARSADFSDSFAVVLRKHRNAKKLSMEALATLAGLHQTYVGLIERRLRNPSLDVAHSLAKALGVPFTRMIAESEALHKRDGLSMIAHVPKKKV